MSLLDDLRKQAQNVVGKVAPKLLDTLRAQAAKVVTPTPKTSAPIQSKAPIQSVAPKPASIQTPAPQKKSVLALTTNQPVPLLDQLRAKSARPLGSAISPTIPQFVTTQQKQEASKSGANITGGNKETYFDPVADKVRARDVIREIPGATATTAKNIAQGTARSLAGVGVGATDVFRKEKIGSIEAPDVSDPSYIAALHRTVFGEEPIKTPSTVAAELEQRFQSTNNPVLKKTALPLAVAGSVGSSLLDVFPGGAAKKAVVKNLVKETTETGIKQILKNLNIEDDLIETIAPALAREKSESGIKQILKTFAVKTKPAAPAAVLHPKVAQAIPENDPLKRVLTVEDNPSVKGLLERSAKFDDPADVYANVREHYTDELTGLLGQKFFKQTNMEKAPQIFLDIDNFGKFNADFSQTTGDKVLETFGKLIDKHFPGKGVRAGGEEFVIDPSGITRPELLRRLQGLREELMQQSFIGEGGPMSGQVVKDINFTSGFGADTTAASSAMKVQKKTQKGLDNIGQLEYNRIINPLYDSKGIQTQRTANQIASEGTSSLKRGTTPTVQGFPRGEPGIGADIRAMEGTTGQTGQVARFGDTKSFQEAKKYKSAEDYVDSKILYHGTSEKSAKNILEKGVNTGTKESYSGIYDKRLSSGFSTTKDFNAAKDFQDLATPSRRTFEPPFYTKEKGQILAITLKDDARILQYKDLPENLKNIKGDFESEIFDRNITRYARENGYDAIDLSGKKGIAEIEKEINIVNKDAIEKIGTPEEIKSQLTDFWHRTTSKQPQLSQKGTRAPEVRKTEQTTLLGQSGNGKPPSNVGKDSSYPEGIPQESDPVKTIIKALKDAKPIRKEQEALYSAERSKRAGRIEAIGRQVKGEKGFYAQLSVLKGELPKAQFEGIKKQISQENIEKLFNMIQDHADLLPYDKIAAKKGLLNLLGAEGGRVPTNSELALLGEVFPPEFIQAVLSNRPIMQRLWTEGENVLNVPRAIMSTVDLSAPLRQGVFLIGRPKQFVPAFGQMFKYALSEKAYQGLLTSIKQRPTYPAMREAKLALTDLGTDLTAREEAFMSNIVEKIPIFGRLARGSNRAYSGFLNKLRADVFDDIYNNAKRLDKLEGNTQIVRDMARFVNSATGRGDLPKWLQGAAPTLNALFFSPRLMASRLNLLNPAYYVRLDPFVRKEALKSLFAFTAIAGTVLTLVDLATDADVSKDLNSADALKVKIGNTRIDILGGFQQYLVLASRLATGKMVSSTTGKEFTLGEGYKPTTRLDIIQRFFESKTSPIASFALGMLKGQTAMGEDFKVSNEIADRFLPMMTQDMFDLYKEYGWKGLGIGTAGIFGVGSQTYTDRIPLESKTATGKPTIKWRNAPSLGETIVNKVTGKELKPLPAKVIYDQVQILKKEGKTDAAQKLVDGMSDEDYALYKKIKEKDERIAKDEVIQRMTPVYKSNRKLIEQGKTDEAQRVVDALSDEEYEAYKKIKEADYKTIQ